MTTRSGSRESQFGRRPTVLIVDDSPEYLQMLVTAFGDTANLVTARDGFEGYTKACETLPDIVILDVGMPILDGWSVCRKLRLNKATARIPVLIVTGSDGPDVEHEARVLGVKVLRRPCAPDILLAAIHEVLRSHGRRQQLEQADTAADRAS